MSNSAVYAQPATSRGLSVAVYVPGVCSLGIDAAIWRCPALAVGHGARTGHEVNNPSPGGCPYLPDSVC